MKDGKGVSWLLFVLLALIWGSSFILIKKSAEGLTGGQIGAVRIFSASLVFLPFAFFHVRQLPRAKIPIVILTGLIGNLIPAFLFGIAIQHSGESSLAGILNSLTPLFVIIIGVLFFGLKVPSRKMAGVLVGFIGLFILSATKGPIALNEIGYTLLILLATLCYGLNVNIVGRYLKGLDPVKMATVSIGFLILPTAVFLWLNPVSFSAQTKGSIFAAATLGVLGSALATVLFYTLIKKAGGLFASLVTYAVPIVAIGWGLLYKEAIGLVQFACLGVILSGVYLANKTPNP